MNTAYLTLNVGDTQSYQFFGKEGEEVFINIDNAVVITVVTYDNNDIGIKYLTNSLPLIWESANIEWQTLNTSWESNNGYELEHIFNNNNGSCDAKEVYRLLYTSSVNYYMFDIEFIPSEDNMPSGLRIYYIEKGININNWIHEDGEDALAESEISLLFDKGEDI